jgi:predicted acylesterase/phospholipase RssA
VLNLTKLLSLEEANQRKMPENIENQTQATPIEKPNQSFKSPEDKTRDEKIQLAKDILRGVHGEVEDMNALYKALKKYSKFGLARKILYILRKEQPNSLKLYQQEALCTYKDPDLPSEVKFKKAIDILRETEDLDTTENTETLGLLGSIYKRKWLFDNQFYNLKKSKYYYYRGHKIWLDQLENNKKDTDYGYTGINAAYVLDLMATLMMNELKEVGAHDDLDENLKKLELAKKIRTRIFKELSKKVENNPKERFYWVYTTLVEACLGINEFEKAKEYWNLALATKPENWELESTKTQLIQLGQILLDAKNQESVLKTEFNKTKSDSADIEAEAKDFSKNLHNFLETVLEVDAKSTEKVLSGKVGLALSGGGFRAAFYHVGVLAKMAEFDLLKHVEVISCVSGGSIIGAYYYLKLLLLFEQKEDHEIEQADYIQLVREIESEFLEAVKFDIRGSLFTNPLANLKMAFSKNYSRSNRLAELYEKHFYKKLFDQIIEFRRARGMKYDWKGPIRMRDLFIFPKDYDIGKFNPKRDNWKRKNKIPNLILNATALNTGHNWQFTASWMGEPPGNIVKEVDAKYRLRRMYYWEAPGKHKHLGLSEAVAASSGVPGVFPPLILDKLYPDQRVQLVDGGVHDNQGIVGLTEQECQIFFVSDSSGQLMSVDDLGKNPVSILARTNSVGMERIRECQYLDLKSRSKSSMIKGLMFVHLRKGLLDKPLDWIYCEDPYEASDSASAFYEKGVLTKYNIRKDVQQLLASVRTDLDAFNDAEAFALMYSGYQMTEYEHLQTTANCLPDDHSILKKEQWNFEDIQKLVESSEKSVWLKKILSVGQGLLFKSFYLSNSLTVFAMVFGLIVVAGITLLFYAFWNEDIFNFQLKVSNLGTTILWIIGGLIAGKVLISVIQYKDTLRSAIKNFLIAITGSLVSVIINPILNRVYLKKGNKEAIEEKKKG